MEENPGRRTGVEIKSAAWRGWGVGDNGAQEKRWDGVLTWR